MPLLLFYNSRTLFLYLFYIIFKLIPKGKSAALKRTHRINRTAILLLIEKNTGEITLCLSFSLYEAVSVFYFFEIYCSEIFDS